MTLRERIFALMQHGDFDEYHVAAIFDLDVSVVAHVLADPTYEPRLPGAHITHEFPFAFNTPNLHRGVVAAFTDGYTPALNDLLIDAWVEIGSAWNGTTPTCDFGGFKGENGWLAAFAGAGVLLTQPDVAGAMFGSPLLACNAHVASSLMSSWLHNSIDTYGERPLPAKFVTTDPIKVVVSQDGFDFGAASGATQGTAVLCVTTARPIR